jgi:hypothetical protein
MKYTEPTDASSGIAALAGDAFLSLAQIFLQSLSTDSNGAAMDASKDIGGLLASATNLSLAIEIYLKAVLFHYEISVPHTHDLPELYKLIPTAVQEQISSAYAVLQKDKNEVNEVRELVLQLARSPLFPDDDPVLPQNNSVLEMLSRNKNAFMTWRYAFSELTDKSNASLRYEFLYLALIAKAIRGQLFVQSNLS